MLIGVPVKPVKTETNIILGRFSLPRFTCFDCLLFFQR